MMEPIALFDEAVQIVHGLKRVTGEETVSCSQSLGRVLSRAATARVAVPPFARAMMDGFAIRAADAQTEAVLEVIGTVAAGDATAPSVGPGQAVRIMTGAMLPDGVDAVARFEWCEDMSGAKVRVKRPVRPGESIQPAGDDVRCGATVLHAGTRLGPAEVALLQTCGIAEVYVHRRARVSLVITGSELNPDAATALAPAHIYGANDLLLGGLITTDGALVTSIDYVADDPDQLAATLRLRVAEADYVITTGGISRGDYDFVPAVLDRIGATLHLRSVLMRPGSPFVAATLGETTVFGLSGNPAAALIQFELLVRPVIRASMGLADAGFAASGILAADIDLKPIKHVRILRASAAVVDGRILVTPSPSQSPGVISSFAETNCLIRLDGSGARSGTVVPLRWLR